MGVLGSGEESVENLVYGARGQPSDALGITPNYRRNEVGGWFGQAPGDRELAG